VEGAPPQKSYFPSLSAFLGPFREDLGRGRAGRRREKGFFRKGEREAEASRVPARFS